MDCTGRLCPLLVVKSAKAIKGVVMGQVLKMIATDSGGLADMINWTLQTDHEMVESFKGSSNKIYLFHLLY